MTLFKKKTAGRRGEDIACKYLRKKGYKILERNYRFGHLETDIICEKDGTVVFAEVKARSGACPDGERPASAVNYFKKEHLKECAKAYIYYHNIKKNVRLDIVEVYLDEKKTVHIENAF